MNKYYCEERDKKYKRLILLHKYSKRPKGIAISLGLLLFIIIIILVIFNFVNDYEITTIEKTETSITASLSEEISNESNNNELENTSVVTNIYSEEDTEIETDDETENGEEDDGVMLTSSNIYSTIARSIYCSGYSTSTGLQVMTAEYWTTSSSYYGKGPAVTVRSCLVPGDRVSTVFENLNFVRCI